MEKENKYSVSVCMEYEAKEVRRILSYYILHIPYVRFYFILSGLVVVSVFIISAAHAFTGYYIGLSGLFMVCGFIFVFGYYLNPINKITEYYVSIKTINFLLTEEEIRIQIEAVSLCPWSVFQTIQETPAAYILMDKNRFPYIIGKSGLSTDEQTALHALFLEQGKKYICLKKEQTS